MLAETMTLGVRIKTIFVAGSKTLSLRSCSIIGECLEPSIERRLLLWWT
jgi:hypothetical protein